MYSKTFNTYVTFQVLKGFNGLYSGYRLEFQVHTLLGKSRPAIAPLAFVLQVIKFWIKSVLLYWKNSVKHYFLHRLTVRQKYCCRVSRKSLGTYLFPILFLQTQTPFTPKFGSEKMYLYTYFGRWAVLPLLITAAWPPHLEWNIKRSTESSSGISGIIINY